MTRDRGLRRFRPYLEGLETRDLAATLQVVGPNPNVRGAKGPFLNLIVVKDPSPAGRAGSLRVHRIRHHVLPAHPPARVGPASVILPFRGLLHSSSAGSQAGEDSLRLQP